MKGHNSGTGEATTNATGEAKTTTTTNSPVRVTDVEKETGVPGPEGGGDGRNPPNTATILSRQPL
jgi:hypothetical protein